MSKTSIVGAFVALVGFATFAADVTEPVKPRKTGAEIRKMMMERRQKRLIESGGTVISKPDGKIVEIINHQQSVPESLIVEMADHVQHMSSIPIAVVKERSANAGVWVEFVSNASDPSILSAVDDGWAKSNLAKLTADNPPAPKLRNRLEKWMWRSIGAALGIGVSSFQPSLMRNISRIEELDAIPMMQPDPPTLNNFTDIPSFFGIEKVRMATYRKACEEGWAPAPTNDVQKAIWEKVHSLPKTPMKIEFDPKKGK